ncbi:ArsR/SmtB family transcription factor [Streptomyces sp. NPDC090499]|uniref:ArsR/SmtB family transcription factor n=1 Tax=Streptomyces sp. NPDC090499 TaxID=3365965 RepID=UPI0038306952
MRGRGGDGRGGRGHRGGAPATGSATGTGGAGTGGRPGPEPRPPARPSAGRGQGAGASLTSLLGRTRATVLRAVAAGATTGELARVAGVSASSISQHTSVLREAGLITSQRQAASVLHTLTPLGASMLRANLG